MIRYGCELDYYNKIRAFADREGILDKFIETMSYLAKYACRNDEGVLELDRNVCTLFPDFAPQSFTFTMKRRGESNPYLHGGVIFDGEKWGVHT